MREFKGFVHGVDLGGWYSQCDHTEERYDNFIVEEDFAEIEKWGLDHVRLPIDYELVEDKEGNYIQEGFERIRKTIDWARKYNLNVVLDLHKTFGYSFDIGYGESGFFENEKYQERFYKLWEKLATEFSGYGDALAFELLNEVTKKEYCDNWNRIARTCIQRIRAILPDVKILVGGYYNNSIEALKDLDSPYDENIVYNFHCYDPVIFTHQGAGWVEGMSLDFRIPVDASFAEMAKCMEEQTKNMGTFADPDPDKKLSSEYFDKAFAEAVAVAEERNVPLYCGEYGVIENATPEDTLKWYEMISASFNKYGIGRAAWSYREMNFGITAPELDAVRDRIIKLL
ncbi:MAG: cellulase family glycosylhydrolase [Lachnospiraceae bacterium]|nr:cellulase family glycosylhydrolase [Lachnospiraceae bacterium]